MRSFRTIVFLLLVSSTAVVAADSRGSATLTFDQTVDRVVDREHKFVETMRRMHPLAETYIQNLHEDNDHNVEPVNDQYFLGRVDLTDGPRDSVFQKQPPGIPAPRGASFLRRSDHQVFAAGFCPDGDARFRLAEEQLPFHFRTARVSWRGALHRNRRPAQGKSAERLVHRTNLGGRPRLQYCPLQRDLFRPFRLHLLSALRQLAF